MARKRKTNVRYGVAYARYSSDNQRDESIDAQMRAIKEFADQQNIVLIDSYIDRAKSAMTDNRPGFLQMVKDSEKEEFDCIIVHKLDRFARNRYDSAHYKHILKRNGAQLFSVVERLDGSPESIIMESVLEGMAEYYSKNLAREVQKGMRENALKCLHTGGMPPLGFDVDKETRKLIVNEVEAEAVKVIYERYVAGFGYKEITQELNSLGYKTKRGKAFSKNGLNQILKNQKYIGTYVFNRATAKDSDGRRNNNASKSEDEMIIIPGGCPAIISQSLFDLAQEKLKTRTKTQKHSHSKENYLLRSIMRCGACGGTYVGKRRVSKKEEVQCSYGCNVRYRTYSAECQNKEVSKKYIEAIVLDKLCEYLFHDSNAAAITKEYNAYLKKGDLDSNQRLSWMKSELVQNKSESEKVVELLIKSSSDILLSKLDTLDEQREELEKDIAILEKNSSFEQVQVEDIRLVFEKIRKTIKGGNFAALQRLVQSYVHEIVIYDEHIDITFNFFPTLHLDFEHEKREESQPLSTDSSLKSEHQQKFVDENGGGEGN